ncbi:MAG: hypothetical protein ABFC81_01720 [Rectinema sp.]
MEATMKDGKRLGRPLLKAASTLAVMFGSHGFASTGSRRKSRYRAIGGGEVCRDFYGGTGHPDFCGDRAMLDLYRIMAGTDWRPLR